MNERQITLLKDLREHLSQMQEVSFPEDPWSNVQAWISRATPFIRREYPDLLDDFLKVTSEPRRKLASVRVIGDEARNLQLKRKQWTRRKNDIDNSKKVILSFIDGILSLVDNTKDRGAGSALDRIVFICDRFPLFVRQLRERGRDRTPLLVDDEYDLQHVLLALLRLEFDDVRSEEWTPSYAGGSSRMDFLMKSESIVLEAKKTRETLRDRQVADQLIIDIDRYSEHPDCKTLICFVYDPDGILDNPKGLELDLSGSRDSLQVIVLVR